MWTKQTGEDVGNAAIPQLPGTDKTGVMNFHSTVALCSLIEEFNFCSMDFVLKQDLWLPRIYDSHDEECFSTWAGSSLLVLLVSTPSFSYRSSPAQQTLNNNTHCHCQQWHTYQHEYHHFSKQKQENMQASNSLIKGSNLNINARAG